MDISKRNRDETKREKLQLMQKETNWCHCQSYKHTRVEIEVCNMEKWKTFIAFRCATVHSFSASRDTNKSFWFHDWMSFN